MNAEGMLGLILGTIADVNESRREDVDALEKERQHVAFLIMDHGSGFEGSKVRIYAACKKWQNDLKKLKWFLKEEYGTGGYGSVEGWMFDYSGSMFRAINIHEKKEHWWTWDQMTKVFLEDYLHGGAIGDMKTMQRIMEIERTTGLKEPVPRLQYPL